MAELTLDDCKRCGACCIDQLLPLVPDDQVPIHMINGAVMGTQGGRCIALRGRLGIDPRCSIYDQRPMVCRVFPPGSQQCHTIRRAWYFPTPTNERIQQ